MRTAFAETMLDLAAEDPQVVLLTADLGFGVLEPFAQKFPDRFVNVGVAEANMIGLATGMALDGWRPYVYSIATFASMRGYEQIRNGPVLHQLPVTIIGTGGGFAYGHAGITHFALEDFAILRALPGMTVIAPADPPQTRSAIRAAAALPGPVYFRVGKGGNPTLPALGGRFRLSEVECVVEGKDLLILATGSMVPAAVSAAQLLERQGIRAAVGVAATIHPAPKESLQRLAEPFPLVLAVEEHFTVGGLGSMVAEALSERPVRPQLLRIGVNDMGGGVGGSAEYLRQLAGLTPGQIAARADEALREVNRNGR